MFLVRDTWNDYGFETLFGAVIALADDETVDLGSVIIAFFGHVPADNMRDILPAELPDGLPEGYFSLGQKLSYYEILAGLSGELCQNYANTMRDVPMLGLPLEQLEQEPAFEISLLRTSGAREALDKAPALFGEQDRLVEAFDFTTKLDGAAAPHTIAFDFSPDGPIPNRINALVGVNGVGKTQLMARLAMLLTSFEEAEARGQRTAEGGTLRDIGTLYPLPSFYGVIAVSFSAFDDFELPNVGESAAFRYTYCGLRQPGGPIVDENVLAARIPTLLHQMDEDRRALAVGSLSDGLARALTVEDVLAEDFYRRLSAGQRIVANIIAELCLHLRLRSLVLLDEPETHLHPQLITRLMSVVQDVLEGFDSAAVVATHSPIVIQQVRADRVHIIRRLDQDVPVVDMAPIETFGENLSDIVRVVFDAPEADRGYQQVLDRLLEDLGDPDAVEALFGGRLGFNAQVYLRSRASDA